MELKKILFRVVVFLVCLSIIITLPIGARAQEIGFEIQSKSALLMDYSTGTILYEKNPHEKLPIASITKIMTILLALEAIQEGRISLDDEVSVSEYAASMGGSQVFLYPGEKLPVSAILKAIIVASGNDASVAIAEKIAGTHETFVARMNQRAQELGMNNTHFANSTGLPHESHYSTAYDISIMSRELLKYPLFFKWSTIWLENLQESQNNTELTNTNRLVRFYDGCDGIKTGSTNEAKNCISATAKRGNLRLISVILAGPTSDIRFKEASKLMDYGFANYEIKHIVKRDQVVEKEVDITGGKEKRISGIASVDFSILQKKGEPGEYTINNHFESTIKAPIHKGQRIGYISVQQDGKDIGSIDILADRDVKKANIYDYFKDIIKQWIQKGKDNP